MRQRIEARAQAAREAADAAPSLERSAAAAEVRAELEADRSRGRKPRVRTKEKWVTNEAGARVRVKLPPAPLAAAAPSKPSRPDPSDANAAPPKQRWRWDVSPAGARVRRALTDQEILDAAANREQAKARDLEFRRQLSELIPTIRIAGEPPTIQGERPIPLDSRTIAGAELVSCLRPNGSRLRLVGRYYDGQYRTGHRPLAYVSAYVVFANPRTGLTFRTRGVMFERGELRAAGRALLDEADRLDEAEAAGELPSFIPPELPTVRATAPTATVEPTEPSAAPPVEPSLVVVNGVNGHDDKSHRTNGHDAAPVASVDMATGHASTRYAVGVAVLDFDLESGE